MKKLFLLIFSIMSLLLVACATSNELVEKEKTTSLSSNEEQKTTAIDDLTGEYVLINDVGESESKIDRIILFPDGTCNIHEVINSSFADFINRSCTYSYDHQTSYIMFTYSMTDGFIGLATIEDDKIVFSEYGNERSSIILQKKNNE